MTDLSMKSDAERRWPRKQSLDDPYPPSRYRAMSVNRRIVFEQGVEWADANPYDTDTCEEEKKISARQNPRTGSYTVPMR